MNKKRIVVVLGSIVAGMVAATQFAAHWMNYDPSLEQKWLSLGDRGIYAPWAFLVWISKIYEGNEQALDGGFAIFVLASMLGMSAGFVMARPTPMIKAFGKDAWGTFKQMKQAGLMADNGVVVGVHRKDILCYDGPEHQLVSGASRSGKGVGHVVPTLLTWPGSVLVYDIKNELWDLTAGFRGKFSHAAFFNPTKAESVKFNPLFEVRKGPEMIRDVQNITEILVDPDGSKQSKDIWDQQAGQFLTALIMHVLYIEADHQKNLGRVRQLVLDFDATCQKMIQTPHILNKDGQAEVHPEIKQVAQSLLDQSARFRSSVRGTVEGHLTLFADPVVVANTASSDFLIGDLVCSKRSVSLYLQPPPSDATRVRPLIRLMLSQVARTLMENQKTDNRGRAKKHKLLFLVDEFPTLGKLAFFSENMRVMAGYGLKAHIIVQSFNDIASTYGPTNTIIDNCHVLVAFASADTTTQRRISEMAGDAVEYRQSYSRPRNPLAMGRQSATDSEQIRPLLRPGEVRTLPEDQQLIFVTGHPPFKTKKLRYFENALYKSRLFDPPDQKQVIDLPGEMKIDWYGERAKGPTSDTPDTSDASGSSTPLADGGDTEVGGQSPKSPGPESDTEQQLEDHDQGAFA